MPDDRLTWNDLPLFKIRGCGIKIRRATPGRQIGFGVKNPAAEPMVADDPAQNREE